MSTTRVPWCLGPREQWHNRQTDIIRNEKTHAAGSSPASGEANVPNDGLRVNPSISVTEVDPAEAAVISDGLRAYYLSQTGYYDFRPLALLVHDPQTSKVIGG